MLALSVLATALLLVRLPAGVALNRGGLSLNRAEVAPGLTGAEVTAASMQAGAGFQRTLALRPGRVAAARAYANLGALYATFGDTTSAAQAYGEAVARAPGDRMAQFFYGEALAALGEEAAAREAWAEAEAAGVFVGRAKELKTDDPAAALLNAERAMAIAPDAPESVKALGDILSAQGQITEALMLYQDAAARVPDEASFYREAGLLLRRQFGDDEGALAALERALALDPEDAAVRLELARIFADRGACYEAEGYLAPLLRLAPGAPPVESNEKTAHVIAAQCHLDAGRPRTAIPYLAAVVSDGALAGKDPAVGHLLLLARAYREAGETAAAIATYEWVLALQPEHSGAQEALAALTDGDDNQ